MSDPTARGLGEYLRAIRAARPPVITWESADARAAYNSAACDAELAGKIAGIANRPPTGLRLCKYGSRSVVGSIEIPGAPPVVAKYYYPKNPLKCLTYGIKGSRCHQSWMAGLAFGHVGIPTPEPLFIAERRMLAGAWLDRSFLATRAADGIPLDTLIRDSGPDHPLVEKAAESLQRSFALMAECRMVHGDLKANNLFVGESGVVVFIDLDGARVGLTDSAWRAAREKDHRRFMANWLKEPETARRFDRVFDDS